jgi:tripartite-type tricarboxylate transporter receptor subunit TctC
MKRAWKTALAALAASFAAIAAPGAMASDVASYPTKPIRIVVTFPPGGSADSMIRLIAPKLAGQLGQQVIIDNRPGAGGNIGLTQVARAAPDGYTLGLGAAGGLSANVSLYAQMPFDPVKDFAPISMVAFIPFILVANPSVPADKLPDLLAMARKEPGALSVGHGGNGTGMHLSAALLAQMADIRWTDVAYKGTGPATTDVLGGQIPLAISDMPASLQLIQAGRLKPLAVTSAQRLPALPDVPTVSEAGVPGYESVGWFGLVAPAQTPPAIVAKVNAGLKAALADPELQASIRGLGVEPSASTPDAFGAFIQAEIKKWAGVIKAADIRAN